MGISREVFKITGGFHFDRLAEDIELSVRLRKLGLRVGLIPEAFVYHQRRTTLREFFKQVSNFGKGRALVGRAHHGEVKLVHWFPSFFLLGLVFLLPLALINYLLGEVTAILFLIYLVTIGADSLKKTKSIAVAVLSIPSAVTQLTGYGYGLLRETLRPAKKPRGSGSE